ncbi:MAG: Bug family tripartite tricarboxylate transporter substrate binding protein [Bacillota bacterium]
MKKILVLSLLAIFVLSLTTMGLAAYPEEEIEWVLWSSPGGGSDTTARTVGIPLRSEIGEPLVVKNMPGGSGARAMEYVQEQKADGYTWLFITNTLITTTERGLVDYSYEDWEPVFMLNHDPQTIAVSADSGIESFEDLVDLGKERTVKWGLTHLGGNDHVAINSVAEAVGLEYDPIVYESGAEVMVGALGGSIDVFISNPSEIMGQVEAGKINIIASMSEKRLSILPDTPTLKELGHDIQFGTWRGVAVKAGTDPEVINKIESMLAAAADSEIYREFLKDNGMDYNVKDAKEFNEFIEKQWSIFADGLKKVGL